MKVYCHQCGEGFTVRPQIKGVKTNPKGYLEVEFETMVVDHICDQPQDT